MYKVVIELNERDTELGNIEISVETKGQARKIAEAVKATHKVSAEMTKKVEL